MRLFRRSVKEVIPPTPTPTVREYACICCGEMTNDMATIHPGRPGVQSRHAVWDLCLECYWECPCANALDGEPPTMLECVRPARVSDEEFEEYRQRLLKEVTSAVREPVAEA